MKMHTGVGLFELAARVLFSLLAASAALAQSGKEGASNQAEEKFKEVDPYTKGDADLVRQAGYKNLRPTSFAQDIQAQDMLELLGGIELVWAETEHFKICSSLQTYKSKGDPRENAALEKELVVLTRKIPGCRNARASKLDPWLRLHLYAMRLEQLYAEFCERTGFCDADFHAAGTTNEMGSGPYLGQALKPTVLLAEKRSAVERFNHRYGTSDAAAAIRIRLNGGSMFFGISAESMRDNGYELDSALRCAVVEIAVASFLDGLRDSFWATPLWLDTGLGHWFSRRIDERFSYYADGTSRFLGDNLYLWRPRVRGLVENKFSYSWSDMLGTLEWTQFTPQAHMLIWSRIDWMMQQKPADLRKLLDSLTVKLPQGSAEQLAKVKVARATAGLAAAFGKSPEECDGAWSAWVLKTYEKN